MEPDGLLITYHLEFADGRKLDVTMTLNPETYDLLPPAGRGPPPTWAAMETFRCPNCPLPAGVTHCPMAVALQDLLALFRDGLSHDKVQVEVVTPERRYTKESSLQAVVGALLGISMATSGCPILARLKPMARFHLPFAGLEETRYRAMTMYLLAQFFRATWAEPPDWSMGGLTRLYDEIRVINLNVFNTLTAQRVKDASLNAVSILDSFAAFTTGSMDAEMLTDLELLFSAWRPAPPG